MPQLFIKQIMDKMVMASMTNKRVENEARKRAISIMRSEKDNLINEFDNHAITRELDLYNGDPDIRGFFLPRGNLFSFIGFYKGDKPTDDIRGILKESIRLEFFPIKRRRKDGAIFSFRIKEPTLKEIWAATPYPDGWKSGSWANDLEQRGIDNLEYFMFSKTFETKGNSRSGRGLQKKFVVNPGEQMDSFPYIRALLRDFRGNVRRHGANL